MKLKRDVEKSLFTILYKKLFNILITMIYFYETNFKQNFLRLNNEFVYFYID